MEKKIKLPTPKEMKTFAKRFSKEEWAKLCAQNDFYPCFSENLDDCKVMAEMILADVYSREKFKKILVDKAAKKIQDKTNDTGKA